MKQPEVNKSYLGAVPKNPTPKESNILPPDDPGKKNAKAEKLEKEDRSAILAQWKREHDERLRQRREFFQVIFKRLKKGLFW